MELIKLIGNFNQSFILNSRRTNPAKPDILHQPSEPATMDAEQTTTKPCGLRPTVAKQHRTTSTTAYGPKSTVLTAELRQLPTPTTHVGAKRDEANADSQHCAKHGPECTTECAKCAK